MFINLLGGGRTSTNSTSTTISTLPPSKNDTKLEPNESFSSSAPPLLTSFSLSNPLLISISTAILLSTSYLGYQKFGKRIRNVDELVLPNSTTSRPLRLRGFVTSVGDADNFRIYHKPLLQKFKKVPSKRNELKGETIHVRLAGIDAPELAHFGKPAQPFSKQAFDYLNETLLHKKVLIELYQKDRYSRVVSTCFVRVRKFPFLVFGKRRNVSEEMLKLGLATVYRESGACYGGGPPGTKLDKDKKEWFEKLENRAKQKKLGMWSLDKENYESPADYKKRTSS